MALKCRPRIGIQPDAVIVKSVYKRSCADGWARKAELEEKLKKRGDSSKLPLFDKAA